MVKTIRQARRTVLDAGGALTAVMKVAQSAFQLPDSVPWQTLHGFAETWTKKPAADLRQRHAA